ncbi:MAG: zinc chelation protein SecC [Betaproteobacteria bacterium HGW-Betaproteobacteria-22]|nr:MAG: zinc chelation protein SecC [Betaproteobacteria bacterium HGW-Betaproteobacteria-22]
MSLKIGRNDPCPCGSGKKYKQCCALAQQAGTVVKKGHDGAIERAVAWLNTHHRKAISRAIDIMLFEGLSENDQDKINALDNETWQGIQINANEWLLAEGLIQVKNEEKRVVDVLLGIGGPLFTIEQRQWIQQLSEQPMRLYDVTDVIPNQQMTLCDALDTSATPIIVKERAGSQVSLIGSIIGARLMPVDDHYELSGSVYAFSRFMGATVLNIIHKDAAISAQQPIAQQVFISFIIRRKWLEQFIKPMAMPAMMDAQSGNPLLFITDHYRVRDWDALSQILASKKDIEGDRIGGWSRLKKYPDGLTRSTSSINISDSPNQIELFHKTQAEADKGRKWFDKLASDAVEFTGREISDPMGMLKDMPAGKAKKSTSAKSLPNKAKENVGLHPDIIANLIEQRIHHLYANWPDEPIPALDGKTPGEAITTASGLERVKGLIRSYEEGEEAQALEQGRREISYAFLWRSIGLKPD